MAASSTKRTKASCASRCRLVWFLTTTRSHSTPIRKCKAPFEWSLNCSNGRAARTACPALPGVGSSLPASILRRRLGWQTALGTTDPFAGARYPGESILCRHLGVRPTPSLQADCTDRRDPHPVAPDAAGRVARRHSGSPSGVYHLGSIPRKPPPLGGQPNELRSPRRTGTRGPLFAAGCIDLWHLWAAAERALYRQWRPLPDLSVQLEASGSAVITSLHERGRKAARRRCCRATGHRRHTADNRACA